MHSPVQSPTSATNIDKHHSVTAKYLTKKLTLERTVTQDAEELGIVVPYSKNNRKAKQQARSDKESDSNSNSNSNSDRLAPNTTKNNRRNSISYGNNTIREESSDSEEIDKEKYMRDQMEFFKQERLFKRRISQKQSRRGSFNLKDDSELKKSERIEQIRKKRRENIRNKEFIIELDSEGFFGSNNDKDSNDDHSVHKKTYEKMIEDSNIHAFIPSENSKDDNDEDSMNENVDF